MSTATARHLEMLHELAETGMVFAERLHDLPPLPGQNCARDLDIISRIVRRCILLYHLLETGNLPQSKPAAEPKPESTPTPSAPSGDARTRLDPIDKLDDVSGPFQEVVASIVRDIQSALASCHYPVDQADLVQDIVNRRLPLRHEADVADLK